MRTDSYPSRKTASNGPGQTHARAKQTVVNLSSNSRVCQQPLSPTLEGVREEQNHKIDTDPAVTLLGLVLFA